MTNTAKNLGLMSPQRPSGKPNTNKDKLAPLLESGEAHGNEQKATFLEAIVGLSGARNIYGTVV